MSTPCEDLMRYVVTTGPGVMSMREEPAPDVAAGQALIRVEMVGLCGSDYHLYDGSHPYARFPQVQGHEFVGTVADFGPGYSGVLQVGERVAIEPLLPCRSCFACRRGRYNCCVNLRVMGAHVPGGLADFVAVDVSQLVSARGLPAQTAVLIEPVSIGLQCIRRADVQADDKVVVIGAGPIGLAAMLAALDCGAQVLVADREASRLARAARLGACAIVDTGSEDLAAAATAFTDGDGPAVVVEATGVPALVRVGVEIVAHSGTVVVVGISTDEVGIPVSEFSRKELNLLGSRNNTGLFEDAAELVHRHAERLAPLVTHEFPLERTGEAIEFAMSHPADVEKVAINLVG